MPRKTAKKTDEQKRELLGILIMAMGLLVFLGLISYNHEDFPNSGSPETVKNWLGLAGAYISYYLYVYTIGYACLVIPFLVFLFGWNLFLQKSFKPYFRIALLILALGLFLSTALAMPEALSTEGSTFGYRLSGLLGGFLADQLARFFGAVGSVIVLLTILILFLVSATSWSMREAVLSFQDEITGLFSGLKRTPKPKKQSHESVTRGSENRAPIQVFNTDGPATMPLRPLQSPPIGARPAPKPPVMQKDSVQPQNVTKKQSARPNAQGTKTIMQPTGPYQMPPLELLNPAIVTIQEQDIEQLRKKAEFLEEKLSEFGVQGEVTGIQPGPVITRFEVSPAPGVKVSRFMGVQDDLALVMRASRVRIMAPIPGKAAVGIEIPNEEPAMVSLREIITSEPFQKSQSKLTIAFGKTSDGKPYVTDLAQLPHLLVAGATGSGKSVCLNTIISSLLYRAKPNDLKFILIDPKKLELNLYKKLKHHHLTTIENLGEDVITTVENAVVVLRSVEKEMERRYRMLARVGVRNIDDFNKFLKTRNPEDEEEGVKLEHLPYLVIVVDELADLMMLGAREIEEPIARLAQMSRAVGIHLILATQRPSVDVITGVIKANFPARIAFQVTSKTDSRTILDRNGAEKLLGRGDMLFLHPREPEPIRIHGAFMSTDEVLRIVQHVSRQPREELWRLPGVAGKSGNGGSDAIGGERDELFWEAAKLVVRHQQGSASLLQRRLRVGYARAGRLIDELEDLGFVGPFDGSKAREVLVDEEGLELIRSQQDENSAGF
ncbi:DNA translocase FtsK [candidate division KSB1 bacterium]|nr:DNA translocase FtsK [candidate division KSB1 bacterium]